MARQMSQHIVKCWMFVGVAAFAAPILSRKRTSNAWGGRVLIAS
jgi:hypothetical protein